MTDRDAPPMLSRVQVLLTVREDGSREGLPVIVLNMIDPAGDSQTVHIGEDVGMELVGDVAVALRQLKRGSQRMPYD